MSMADGARNRALPLEERFWMKVDKRGPDECWPWLGAKNPSGHGRFWIGMGGRRNTPAHRFSFEVAFGPISLKLHLDHIVCDNPPCVNPAHLKPVTLTENLFRDPLAPAVLNRAKTHCPQGHPYDEANTLVSGGARHCRTCNRERARIRYQGRRRAS